MTLSTYLSYVDHVDDNFSIGIRFSMPFGDNHLMTDRAGRSTRPIGELTSVDSRGMGQLVVDGDGAHTSLICGTVEFDAAGVHPILSLLPPLVAVHDTDGRGVRLMERIIELASSAKHLGLTEWTIEGVNAVMWRTRDGRRAAYTLTRAGQSGVGCKIEVILGEGKFSW